MLLENYLVTFHSIRVKPAPGYLEVVYIHKDTIPSKFVPSHLRHLQLGSPNTTHISIGTSG